MTPREILTRALCEAIGDEETAGELADAALAAIEASGTHCIAPLERYEGMQEALEQIVSWSEAYPLNVFPEPDLKKARELLAAGGVNLDAISAHCMRHVIEGVAKIALAARPRDVASAEQSDGN